MVIIGAGFDTRSIRYQRAGLRFFEVDLPETISAKRCVHERYRDDVDPQVRLPTLVGMATLTRALSPTRTLTPNQNPSPNPSQVNLPTLVGFNLNDCEHESLLSRLEVC